MSEHPSFLALDRAHLRGEPCPHAECPRCAAHLEAVGEPGPIPAWVGELGRRRRRGFWARPMAAAAAVAAACVVAAVSVGGGGQPESPEVIRAKGNPALALYVKRGDRVSSWSGGQYVRPGDRLRLELAGAGFRHAAVFTDAGGELRELWRGRLEPGRPPALPVAWEVDAAPGPETLIVALSTAPVEARRVAPRSIRQPDLWVETLTLPKDLP